MMIAAGILVTLVVALTAFFIATRIGNNPPATHTAAPETATARAVDTPTAELSSPTPFPATTVAIPPGHTQISPMDGMIQVRVPSAVYEMGRDSGPEEQRPAHIVSVDGFWMDQTEVTNFMFGLFVQTASYVTDAEKEKCSFKLIKGNMECVPGASWKQPNGSGSNIEGQDKVPVVHVSWADAQAYCAWRKDGSRLPSEAEWELAARGTDGRLYPWGGTSPSAALLNFNMDLGFPVRVGSYPNGASPFGALDMAGNVAEWVADWYGEKYYASSPAENPTGPSLDTERVVRGGSWNFNEIKIRATFRDKYPPAFSNNLIGFRCTRPE